MQTNIARWNAFTEAAYLDKKYSPWLKRKPSGNTYANIMITDCGQPNWWYADFIGIECFAELKYCVYPFNPTVQYLREAIVVRLHGVMINSGRSIDSNDFIIL